VKNSIEAFQQRIENVLEIQLNDSSAPPRLASAMRYSTLGGGKRLRALLVYGAGAVVNAPYESLDFVAAALECIQAYSLIHDDLPSMDNDDLRRGKPTNHIKYDEATAILAGDALLTLAFELIAKSDLADKQARQISNRLSQCAGRSGMVGGQMLDILATQQQLNLAQLEEMHSCKTGALINAAVVCGALCGVDQSDATIDALDSYANKLGLAFQVVDDILDIESTTEQLGKPRGSDANAGKATYPALIGLNESKKLAKNLYQEAIESLQLISDNGELTSSFDLLTDLASLVIERTH